MNLKPLYFIFKNQHTEVEWHLKPEELEAATGISNPAPGSCENENNNNKEISHGSLLKLAKFEQANTPLTELHLRMK